ncbi:hypothetical protein [Ochrobactrum sp. A-1]|uniref:hypothetical protein n=1 Tax=Ochrobactrum sp. A-1 TaxID=2920940 RepID=UPI001F0B2289|nr:hypothetical protein [Ochrobactrum sp. A-1]
MKKAEIRNAIEQLYIKIRPMLGMEARLHLLNAQELERYYQWKQEYTDWSKNFSSQDEEYEAYLNGETGPALPFYIKVKLSGNIIHFPKNISLESIRETYDDCR